MAKLEGEEGLDVPTDEQLFKTDKPAFGGEDATTDAAGEIFDLLGGSGEPEDREGEGAGETDDAGASREDDPALGPDDGEEYDDEDFRVDADEYEESEETYEEPEGDEPEEPEDVEATEESDEDSDFDPDQTFTVTVDGEEQEVTLEEALNGYMRTSAFTRKTQELADQRRQVREVAEQIRAERQQYAEGLEQVEQVLEAIQPEKPDPSLRKQNPQEYARRMEQYEQRQEQIESVQEEREAAQKQNQQEALQARQRRLQEEKELLEAAIPELTDPEKGPELRNQMVETAQEEYGFAPEELSAVEDHRALRLLHDAMRYRELEETGRKVTEDTGKSKKNRGKSKTLKPGTSKDNKEKSKSSSSGGSEDARKRLEKTGSVHDAASYIESLMD